MKGMAKDLEYYDQKNYSAIVFSCIDCKTEASGRDLNYRKDDVIPEISSMECPVCGKFSLYLDREATKKLKGTVVP